MDAPSGPVVLFPDIISTLHHLYKMVLRELSCKIPQLDTGLGISEEPGARIIMIMVLTINMIVVMMMMAAPNPDAV